MTIKGDQQRPQIGSLNGNSKLNEQDVEIIRFRAQKKRDELAAIEMQIQDLIERKNRRYFDSDTHVAAIRKKITASKRNSETYFGKCSSCKEMCGLNHGEDINYKFKPNPKQYELIKAKNT